MDGRLAELATTTDTMDLTFRATIEDNKKTGEVEFTATMDITDVDTEKLQR